MYDHLGRANRFGSVEKASAFKEAVDEAERVNTAILEKQTAAADDAEGETKKEENAEENAAEAAPEQEEEKAKADDAAADALAEKLESTAKVAEE